MAESRSQQSATTQRTTKGHYGIDAPKAVRMLFLWGSVGLLLSLAAEFSLLPGSDQLRMALVGAGADTAIGCYAGMVFMLFSSTFGKRIESKRMLDSIRWRGDEQVLDVGCGRGLFLIAAAKRLKTGRAFGIDIWKEEDQSGNRPAATRLNARAEDVVDRVEVISADARQLPFPEHSFDVILSNLCVHNIHGKGKRLLALREIARVLRPGGRIVISDMLHTAEYASVLVDCGLAEVRRSGIRPSYFPFVHHVTARKPPA